MQGYTKEISEQIVTLNGKPAILMDTPGLYEPSDEATRENSRKLTEALKRGYDYKLFFVLLAGNRGLSTEDLALMSTVNDCIRQADGAKIDFRVIVNQIKDDAVYNMYEENVASDNFQGLFATLKYKGFSFDIHVGGVLLVPHDKSAIDRKELAGAISEQIESQVPVKIKLLKDIIARNKDISDFSNVASVVAGILATAAVIAFEYYML